ncbi:MAG: tetratricopeptide repeat protein [Bacilli bacterium]|nr:tetratricopeptide repeat protein [Bacilli bacterium]
MSKGQSRIRLASEEQKEKYLILLGQNKIDEAIKEMERVRTHYPNDKSVIFCLARTLLRNNKDISKALLLFSQIIDDSNKEAVNFELSNYYMKKEDFSKAADYACGMLGGNNLYRCKSLVNQIKADIRLGYYEYALKNYDRLKALCEFLGYRIAYAPNVLFYLLRSTDRLSDEQIKEYMDTNYFARQVEDYSKDEAIEHTRGDVSFTDPEELFVEHSKFFNDIAYDVLFDDCQRRINEMKPTGYGMVMDVYTFPLGYVIGYDKNNKLTSSIQVFTVPTTKDIVTMHPTPDYHINRGFEEDIFKPKRKALAAKPTENKTDKVPFTI